MSTSFSSPFPAALARPVNNFQYRETGSIPSLPHVRNEALEEAKPPAVSMSEEALEALLAQARAEATQQTETRMRAYADELAARNAERVSSALDAFRRDTQAYYARVEGELVRLALSIAAKILHRESQVDPMLVAALVQIALNQLKDGTNVVVRVSPQAVNTWRHWLQGLRQQAQVTIEADPQLEPGGCTLETELGTANFSLDAQLKEVEQGFFDLLAQTPRS